jgi:ribosomal protein S18 acetylase RimI-like enzyme
METEAEVRLAVAQDAVGIGNVARRTWADTYTRIISSETQERLLGRWYAAAALEEAIGQGRSWFYVAVVQGKVIGFAQVLMRERRRGELTRIYVLPEWQRQGIGSGLLREGLAALSTHGAEEVFAHVEQDNAKGIAFYQRSGFHQVRELSLELPGQSLDLLEYACSLAARCEGA